MKIKHIVAYLLKARNAEPEKQTLLVNDSETTFVSKQRPGEDDPAATNTHATIEALLETVLLLSPCKGVVSKNNEGM
jgi:hypothetical protein